MGKEKGGKKLKLFRKVEFRKNKASPAV